mgnify:CR=1 FL=1
MPGSSLTSKPSPWASSIPTWTARRTPTRAVPCWPRRSPSSPASVAVLPRRFRWRKPSAPPTPCAPRAPPSSSWPGPPAGADPSLGPAIQYSVAGQIGQARREGPSQVLVTTLEHGDVQRAAVNLAACKLPRRHGGAVAAADNHQVGVEVRVVRRGVAVGAERQVIEQRFQPTGDPGHALCCLWSPIRHAGFDALHLDPRSKSPQLRRPAPAAPPEHY